MSVRRRATRHHNWKARRLSRTLTLSSLSSLSSQDRIRAEHFLKPHNHAESKLSISIGAMCFFRPDLLALSPMSPYTMASIASIASIASFRARSSPFRLPCSGAPGCTVGPRCGVFRSGKFCKIWEDCMSISWSTFCLTSSD